jgi:hypothetical protein
MSLLNYWPTASEVNQCIKPEAEGAHDSVLLAVHQPAPLAYRIGANGGKVKTTEEELYRYFLTKDVPTGAHVVPITGASGVGKSHLVRLLAARLQSEDADGRYVVIRIPKSASLRGVVELILEPLPNDRYASVKKEFEHALAEVNVETAAINFQAQLEIALGALEKDLREQFRANPANQSLKAQIGHASALPKFMADPEVRDHFRRTVFSRIVKRAIAGQGPEVQEVRVEDFTAEDFELPSDIDLSRTAQTTRMYYSALVAKSGVGMREAATVLNGRVVDQATRQLFQLHEALGGMTLQDVILEIRRLLLKDDRELVILVEDFKALTGIQETLLNVLIQEGVRDGVKQFATMRSAIAVTDGYLAGKDTIATRAKREWVVESQLDNDDEVLGRTKRLVASYLNAARWGQDELKRHYAKQCKNWSGQAWIDPFVDAEEQGSTQLAAFGYVDKVPLFPFSELAIERLARMALTQSGSLVFTPRFVIDHILRNILLLGRDAFAENRFPPPSIEITPATADVAQWLASLPVLEEQRRRYERVVAIWGNAPSTRAEVGAIPPQVFKVFGLDEPGIAAPPSEQRPASKSREEIPILPKKAPAQVAELQGALENWVQKGVRLDQTIANQIRRSLESAINERIDWNGERCVKLPITSNQISIPNSSGEGNVVDNAIQLAPDNRDPDGRLRSELIALVRYYHHNKRQMDYDEVDEDLARIGNLVNRLLPAALKIVRALLEKQLQSATKLLSTNSRLLGLTERGRTPGGLSAFLFSTMQLRDKPPEGAHTYFHEWRALQDEASRLRPRLIELVLTSCGSFQGIGRTANGIDITRIIENFGGDVEKPDIGLLDPLEGDVKLSLSNMTDAKINIRAKRVLDEAGRIKNALEAELGDTFDKNEVADTLRDLTEEMQKGMWNPDEIGQSAVAFKRLCEDFRSSALKEALLTLQAAALPDDGKSDGKAISRIAQFDVNPLIIAHTFVNVATKVTNAAQRQAKVLEGLTQGVDPKGQAQEIRALFNNLLSDIAILDVKGEKECC